LTLDSAGPRLDDTGVNNGNARNIAGLTGVGCQWGQSVAQAIQPWASCWKNIEFLNCAGDGPTAAARAADRVIGLFAHEKSTPLSFPKTGMAG
jgi:hypothetical protein